MNTPFGNTSILRKKNQLTWSSIGFYERPHPYLNPPPPSTLLKDSILKTRFDCTSRYRRSNIIKIPMKLQKVSAWFLRKHADTFMAEDERDRIKTLSLHAFFGDLIYKAS